EEEYADVDDATEEANSSGPASGVVTTSLFDSDLGPGYWIHDDPEAPLQIVFADLRIAPRNVLRLSPSALWFVPGKNDRLPPRQISFHLRRGSLSIGPLRGRVAHVDERSSCPCVALRLIGLPVAAGRQLIALLNDLIRRGGAEIAHEPSPVQEEI